MPTHKSLVRALTMATGLLLLPTLASAQQSVRIAQGFASLSFLPIWGARALSTFAQEGLTATVLASPGGDPAALAALDAGDADLAAVGTRRCGLLPRASHSKSSTT